MQYARIVSVALILFAVVGTTSAQAPQPTSCDPIDGVRFVCGQSGPEDLAVEIWPFYGVMLLVLMLVTYFPEISLWLPRLLGL